MIKNLKKTPKALIRYVRKKALKRKKLGWKMEKKKLKISRVPTDLF